MFRGEFSHNLDAKWRLILPQKFRDGLGDRFIITRGLDDCLFVYGLADWERFELKVRDMPVTDVKLRQFVRFFFGGAFETEADAQGRTIIPAHLREHASLVRDVVSIGVPGRVEIWGKENWTKYNQSNRNSVDEDLARYITEIGF